MSQVLPILSLANLDSKEGREHLATQFRTAAQTTGFMAFVDHGIPPSLIDELFEASKKVFALPMEEKLKYERNLFTGKGYELMGKQSLYGQVAGGHDASIFEEHHGVSDLKEGWMVGNDKHGPQCRYYGRYLHGPNLLPDESRVPGLRATCQKYWETVFAKATSFMRVVALSLDQPEDYFKEMLDDPIAAIRLLRYPPQPEAKAGVQNGAAIGVAPHSDFGLTTWLAVPPSVPGLQVFYQDKWHDVVAPPYSFVVNVADLLSDISGSYKFKSSLHRVINATDFERYSIPFFLEGGLDALVKPVDATTGEFETVEQFMKRRYDFTYVFDEGEKEKMEQMEKGS